MKKTCLSLAVVLAMIGSLVALSGCATSTVNARKKTDYYTTADLRQTKGPCRVWR